MAASPAERQRAYRERKAAAEGRVLGERGGPPRTAGHGTTTMYRHGPCRCALCKKAHAVDNAKHRRSV